MKTSSPLAFFLLITSCLAASAAEQSEYLFDGRSLSGWRKPTGAWMTASNVSLAATDNKTFAIETGVGVLVNGTNGRTGNLLTQPEHGDVEAHLEFVVPKDSNSGIYFQARYEIQVFDSWGVKEPKSGDCGGIYERWKDNQGYDGHAPRINASKPPGEWQSFDVVFRAPRFDASGKKIENARFVKVVHNGQIIHENVELTGPTRAATFENDEKPTGPLMLQGDHGPVAYRNVRLKPIELK